jgi:LytS/YehU family sensor histidine kinase
LRTGIAHSEKRTVHISDEIDYIKAYMEIEKLRFPSKFQFRLTVEDELMEEDYEIPPQLIQPFLENAVKHAFTQANSENGIIELNIQLSDDKEYLIASILDNGIGLNLAKKSDSHNSMGISNVQKQLEILNLSSSIKSTVQLYDRSETGKESTGTIVTLRIATRIS